MILSGPIQTLMGKEGSKLALFCALVIECLYRLRKGMKYPHSYFDILFRGITRAVSPHSPTALP